MAPARAPRLPRQHRAVGSHGAEGSQIGRGTCTRRCHSGFFGAWFFHALIWLGYMPIAGTPCATRESEPAAMRAASEPAGTRAARASATGDGPVDAPAYAHRIHRHELDRARATAHSAARDHVAHVAAAVLGDLAAVLWHRLDQQPLPAERLIEKVPAVHDKWPHLGMGRKGADGVGRGSVARCSHVFAMASPLLAPSSTYAGGCGRQRRPGSAARQSHEGDAKKVLSVRATRGLTRRGSHARGSHAGGSHAQGWGWLL